MDSASCSGQIVDAGQMRRFFEMPGANGNVGKLAASCVAALILLAGYVPSILSHYRIEIGRRRTGPREKGEPAERWIVFLSLLLASAGFCATVALRI